jgi:CheY-like chemotaxis protein/HPt (histidine-containing phosphotransfer) domain-containing protein
MVNLGTGPDLATVLLIDDDMVSREVMATVLTMTGYTVHTANGGQAAIELLASAGWRPDVVLMDAQMPGLSGVPLVAQLRAVSSANIFAVSGSHPPAELIDACDGFLLKPFAPEALTHMLQKHAEKPAPPAPSALDPAIRIVDAETLAQLRSLMPEKGVRQIYAALVADLVQRTAAIEAAIATKDTAEIRRIGHAIKGGCSLAGATRAAAIGTLLENGALELNGNQLDNNSPLLKDLRSATLALQRMLDSEFPA